MPTETLHFENARAAQQLFNHEPRNLQALESQLGVKATSREGWIKLEGPADGLERAKNLFLSLENSLKAGSPVRNREFMQALNIVKHEGVSTLKDLMNDRVLTHDKKPGVTAKTVGQKKYLDAIRQHDITFGVGPAGTIWPAEVTLSNRRQPLSNNSSAIKTANGAPTAHPTMPTVCPASSKASSCV